MKNFVQNGDNLDLIAPYDVSSGDGFLVGNQFAVANGDADQDDPVVGCTNGVYTLKKKSGDTVTQGLNVYWDDTNKEVTITASGNTLIGRAIADVAGAATTVNVRLDV